jgi:glycosyltransferase involved in cell wall biosynthesis
VPLAGRSVALRLAAEHLVLSGRAAAWGADVLFAPGNSTPFLTAGPTVLAIQSMHYSIVPEQMSRLRVAYFSRVVPVAGRRAARVVAVSADIARRLARVANLGRGRIRVVYEGFDPSFARIEDESTIATALENQGLARPFLLFVSSLNVFKNPDKAIRAFARLDRPDLSLAIVGRDNTGTLDRWTDLARTLGVLDRTHFLGFVPNHELPAIYSAAECLLYPSAVETFGLPPLEAMGCDLPVIASNRTSVPEIVGDAALCVDPDDIDALAAAIGRVLDEPELRRTLVARGRRRLERFSWPRAARETLAVLREAAGRGP